MPATRVHTRWTNGNLEFLDMQGNIICTYNGTLRTLDFAGAGIMSIGGTPVAATAADINTLTAARVARIPFSRLTQGTVGSGVVIPDNAIIIGGLYHVTEAYTDAAGAARLSFQANAAQDLLADTAKGTLTLNALVPIIPVFSAAAAVRTTAARDISVRVNAADFTAGAGVLYLYYVVTG